MECRAINKCKAERKDVQTFDKTCSATWLINLTPEESKRKEIVCGRNNNTGTDVQGNSVAG